MTGALCFGLSIVFGGAATTLAWAHARHVALVLRPDADALALSLKRTPPSERLRVLLERTEPGTFEHEIASEAFAAPDADARIAATNAVLSEIDHALAHGARWPATGLRIALFGAGLAAFLAFIAEPTALRAPLASIAVGGVAALACSQAGRTAAGAATRQRRAADALVSVAFSLPAGSAGAAADPPRRRRTTRRA